MKRIDRTGEIRAMYNGLKAKVIRYKNDNDIDIEFENGQISYNKDYTSFKEGVIKCPMIYNIKGNYVECINPNVNVIFYIDLEDLDKINNCFWCKDNNGYIINTKYKKRIWLHRLVMNCPKDMFIDHINGANSRNDNRKINLRICTQSENNRNFPIAKNNTSGYKGVSLIKNKWRARIIINYKEIHLGLFDTKEEAALAYNEKAIEIFGNFARLNEINQ